MFSNLGKESEELSVLNGTKIEKNGCSLIFKEDFIGSFHIVVQAL